jgi:hypothetical protein
MPATRCATLKRGNDAFSWINLAGRHEILPMFPVPLEISCHLHTLELCTDLIVSRLPLRSYLLLDFGQLVGHADEELAVPLALVWGESQDASQITTLV